MAILEGVQTVPINLDRPRRLAITLGAMRRVKEQTGHAIDALGEIPEGEWLDHLHKLIWACLVNEDRGDITPDDIEEMLHPGNLESTVDQFLKLMETLTPKGAEGNGVPAPARVRAGKKTRR